MSVAALRRDDPEDFFDPDIAVDLNGIGDCENASNAVIEKLRQTVFSPDGEKHLEREFTISQAAQMVGRSTQAIRDAEKEGRLPPPQKVEKGSRLYRIGYTLKDINRMRRVFGTTPWRNPETDRAVVLAVQNFKGGVGKSIITCHLAHYLALKGYRVCVIDADPQGTTTSLFGMTPDFDVEFEDTIGPYLEGQHTTLQYAVQSTYWDQVAIVPANLTLYPSEYQLYAKLPGRPQLLDRLRLGINTIKNGFGELPPDWQKGDEEPDFYRGFDVVLIDPPPALGMISMSVLRAANALLVPCRPATIDFASTANFFAILRENLEVMEDRGFKVHYKFLKILTNDMDEHKSAHKSITAMMQQVYGKRMLDTVVKDSAAIDNACGRLKTVYELDKPITSKEVHERAITYLDGANREVETLIRRTWPSHKGALRSEGLI